MARPEHWAVVLIIRRSWVRAPPAPPSRLPTCSRSHPGEREDEPGIGGGQPVVGRRGGHGGEVWHLEHLAPLGEFSERHDLGSDLELGLTPPAESIINGRSADESVRQ